MPFVQFRVHPAVGCARVGNSTKAYHLASDFPYFMQEEFPNVRFKPKPLTHVVGHFGAPADRDGTLTLATYETKADAAFDNKFKEKEGVIFPQGVRFRVFAYVYDDATQNWPRSVFEVSTAHADIEWKVSLANKKSVRTKRDPNPAVPVAPKAFENKASATLDTKTDALKCRRLRAHDGIPNLGYAFLERDSADKAKVNGRLHVIGNEGEVVGKSPLSDSLWSDDWYDSAADGPVTAKIKPKAGGALLTATGVASFADLKFFSYNTAAPLAGNSADVDALPAWVVVGPPDYVPDMGHFVSLWDIGVALAMQAIEGTARKPQPGKHKMVLGFTELDTYKKTDYVVHIHQQLCLFDDVRFVSGEAFGEPELGSPSPDPDRAHMKHPPGAVVPPPLPTAEETRNKRVEHGDMRVNARAQKAALMDPVRLKDPDPTKPIAEWIKIALWMRLRKPITLYTRSRAWFVDRAGAGTAPEPGWFPRRLGRRMEYDKPDGVGLKGVLYEFPDYEWHRGNLRRFHGLANSGDLCGGPKSPPTSLPVGTSAWKYPDDPAKLKFLDDMFWPATFADMPMLRDLAYSIQQYRQFEDWQGTGTLVGTKLFNEKVISTALKTSLAGPGDPDKHFADILADSPRSAPALIDLAHVGAMLGGSFIPGIEVGREAGIARNWSLFHGPTGEFPSLRFKPALVEKEHTHGTLTKDLAIPWTKDFEACDETFWPTARPGMVITTASGPRKRWMAGQADTLPHLGRAPHNKEEYVAQYWKALGFIRRDASDRFIETEQSWH